MLKNFAVLVLFAVSATETTSKVAKHIDDTLDCGSELLTGTLVQLDIEGCLEIPCGLFPGSTYEMAITFRPAASTNHLTLDVEFGIYNVELELWEYQTLKLQPLPGTFTVGNQYRVSTEVTIPTCLAGRTGHVALPLFQGPDDTIPSRHMCRYVPTNVSHANCPILDMA